MNRNHIVYLVALLAGCDSLIDSPCADDFVYLNGACVDPLLPGIGDPEPLGTLSLCRAADLQSDPDNCGVCGHGCVSGICEAGHCVGDPHGHIVGIGHDFTSSRAAQRRVLGNAVALGLSPELALAWWPGVAPSWPHYHALGAAMNELGRPWHTIVFPDTPTPYALAHADVVIVPPEFGDGDQVETRAASWAVAFDRFVRRGGVVIVLEGAGGTSYRFARGAGLFDVGAPVDVTGGTTSIADLTDSLADRVIAPYRADTSSVSFPGAPHPVITSDGATVVFHTIR